MNFDHLSTVSEENSEVNSSIQNEETIPINDLSAFLHKVDTLSSLSYLQKLSECVAWWRVTNSICVISHFHLIRGPPLAHFENINYDEIGPRVGECDHKVWR